VVHAPLDSVPAAAAVVGIELYRSLEERLRMQQQLSALEKEALEERLRFQEKLMVMEKESALLLKKNRESAAENTTLKKETVVFKRQIASLLQRTGAPFVSLYYFHFQTTTTGIIDAGLEIARAVLRGTTADVCAHRRATIITVATRTIDHVEITSNNVAITSAPIVGQGAADTPLCQVHSLVKCGNPSIC
jgi:hypothetical protein